MKCPYCGGPLGLEDAFCPHCGNRNTAAEKHNAQMADYGNRFDVTKNDVDTKVRRLTAITAPVVIIAILLVLIIGAILLRISAWDIRYAHQEKMAEQAYDSDLETYISLLNEKNYPAADAYWSEKRMYMAKQSDEWYTVNLACSYYDWIFRYLTDGSKESRWKKYADDTADRISDDLDDLNNLEKEYSWQNEDRFSDEKMAYIQDIRRQVKTIFCATTGISSEEYDALLHMSQADRSIEISRILKEAEGYYEQ